VKIWQVIVLYLFCYSLLVVGVSIYVTGIAVLIYSIDALIVYLVVLFLPLIAIVATRSYAASAKDKVLKRGLRQGAFAAIFAGPLVFVLFLFSPLASDSVLAIIQPGLHSYHQKKSALKLAWHLGASYAGSDKEWDMALLRMPNGDTIRTKTHRGWLSVCKDVRKTFDWPDSLKFLQYVVEEAQPFMSEQGRKKIDALIRRGSYDFFRMREVTVKDGTVSVFSGSSHTYLQIGIAAPYRVLDE
jgi:hypothetical protein